MDEELAEKIEVTAADEIGSANSVSPLLVEDSIAPVNFAENSDSRTEKPLAEGASARTPLRVPKFLLGLLGIGIVLLSCGIYMMFIAEKPLLQHQVMLWQGYRTPAEIKPAEVAVATRAIAPGELFTADNVSIEPMGNRTTRYPVGHPEYLWGGTCESSIAAGAIIDARAVGYVSSWVNDGNVKCYVIVSKPVTAGEYLSGSVNYRKVKPGEILPPGTVVCDGAQFTAYKALQDLAPGKIVLSSQVVKEP